MKHYLWWPLALILAHGLVAYLSKQNNEHPSTRSMLTLYLCSILCLTPLWVAVSRVSKNLMWDGMLYDNLLFQSFAGWMLSFGVGKGFGPIQWAGLTAVVIGSVLMRL